MLTNVLLIEDVPAEARLLQEMLAATGPNLQIEHVDNLSTARETLRAKPFDAILLDLSLPPESRGIDTLRRIHAQVPHLPIVVLTVLDDEETALQAVQEGAEDYLVKNEVTPSLLARSIRYAIERRRSMEALRRRTRELELLQIAGQELSSTLDLDEILAAILEEVRRLLGIVASSIWLIDSETGELVCQQASGSRNDAVRGWRLAPGEGIAGWVAQNGNSLIVPDTRSDDRHYKGVDLKTGLMLCSILSVPLQVKGEVIGVLQVVDTEPGRFERHHLNVLEPLAASAASAIENARLYDLAQREIAERKWVEDALAWEAGVNAVAAELSEALISSTSIEEVSHLVLERIRRLTGSEFGYVGYIDPQTGYLICPTMSKVPWVSGLAQDTANPFVFKEFSGLWGWVLEHRQPVISNNAAEDPRSVETPEGNAPIRRFLSVPAMLDDKLVGQIALANADRDYTDADLELVLRLTSLYALALQQRHAEEALKRTNKELATLNAIARTVNQSLDLDVILGDALETIMAMDAFSFEAGIIALLFDEQMDELVPVAHRGNPENHPCASDPVPAGTCLCWEAFEKGEIVVGDGDWDSDRHMIRWEEMSKHKDICLPLKVRDQTLGVLTLCLSADQEVTKSDVELWRAIGDQISMAVENAQLFEQVSAARDRLQALSHRLVEVQETERRHIARELHDEVGQLLTGLKLVLEMSVHQPPVAIQESLADAEELVGELVARVRDLSLDLRPAMLDDLGLIPAMMWHFERYTALTNVEVTLKHGGLEGRRFTPELETTVYRIIQEALTNAARHADADSVLVRLWEEDGDLVVQIEDNGHGFILEDVAHDGTTGGLSGMEERAVLLGGSLAITSEPQGGTCITARLPLQQDSR